MDVPFSIALLKAYHAQNNVFRPMIAELGLSVGQPKILGFLTRHDGCMQKELAAMCDIEPATISRLLDKMEADGLISRQTVAGNKRATAISLTPSGYARHEADMVTVSNDEGGVARGVEALMDRIGNS